MAYIIYNNNGSVLLTLADGEVDTLTTSLSLVGKNVNNYGQYVNNNFTKLLTSFSNDTPPQQARTGQLWYDTSESRLKVYNGAEFKPTYGAVVGPEPLTTSTGDLWFNEVTRQLSIWYDPPGTTSGYWMLVGPETEYNDGKFGVLPPDVKILENQFGLEKQVSIVYSYGAPAAMITPSSFEMSTSSSLVYFNTTTAVTVENGITVFDDLDVRGNLYVRGSTVYDRNLTTYFNITSYGDTQSGSTSTNLTNINAGNNALRLKALPNLFSTSTYKLGSEVKVLCQYNAKISVRHFRLESVGGNSVWQPVDSYFNSYTTFNNNITYQD